MYIYIYNDHCILEPAPIWVGLLQERQTYISQVSIDPKAPKVFWQPHRDNKSSKVCFFPPVFASKQHRVCGSNFYQCRGWCSIFITSFLLKIMVQPSENPWKNAWNCPRNHPYLHGSLCFLLRSRTGFRNSEKDLVLNQQKFVNDEIFCTFSLKTM